MMERTTEHQVTWDAAMLDTDTPASVEAFARSIHGFAKRLSPEQRAKFLFALDSRLYWMLGEAAIGNAPDGLHPKHRLMRYHDFFCDRVRRGERVIDLGSGVGALACAIAGRCGAAVTGLDWSARNIATAQARAHSAGLASSAAFELGDITSHRVPGAFDVVVLSNVLEHLASRERLLAMWRAWYSPSRFLIRVPALDRDWRVPYKRELGVEWRLDDTHETEYTRQQLSAELAAAGLAAHDLQCVWGEYWLEARPAATPRSDVPAQSAPSLTHEEYTRLQLERSLAMKAHDPAARARYLIERMIQHARPPAKARVLCVGCRNGHELDHLAQAGFTNAVGIDLHSADPRIRVMDMHSLAFSDGAFDVVYASHCLEHALDPGQAAREMIRVLRPGGIVVLEVPVEYGRRGADLWDFQTPEGVGALFPGAVQLWSEVGPQIGAERQKAARLILRK
ncbi:Demethylrebeccamycin-D-glucose O-methyltransferase [Phycisphaerales bacterium]|nr:Demethylrebeccamycin-D-glucose O-methyltransferase [Phycisphaerales bacterium]